MAGTTSAQQTLPSGVCEDLPATTLASLAEEDPWATLSALNDIKGVLDAYFEAPDGTKLDAVGKAVAEIGVTLAFGDGAGYLVQTGKFYYKGAEWTVEEAGRLQLDAFLCGGVSGGERLPVGGFFETDGAQAVVSGLTCENFGDNVTSFEQFRRLRDLFKGFYTRSLMQFATRQNRAEYQRILDAQWAVIDRTWYARMGGRLIKKLQDDLKRIAQESAQKRCSAPDQPSGKPGDDTSDPALLPTPPIPPGGGYVLIRTETVTQPVAPDTQITAGPQKSSFKAPYGEMTCAWTSPPKLASGEFGIAIQVTSTPAAGQDLQAYMVVRSGFMMVSGTVNELSGTANEAYANGTDGVPGSGSASMRLTVPDLTYAVPGGLLYFMVGGCGANVTYVYEFAG